MTRASFLRKEMYRELITEGPKIIHEFIVRQLDLSKVKERKKNITLCGFRRIGRDLSYLSFSQCVCVCKKAPLLQDIHTSYLLFLLICTFGVSITILSSSSLRLAHSDGTQKW